MHKHLIRRFVPEHHKVRKHRHLRVFGQLLHDPNLWHLNRRSISGAMAVGLFMAFVPIPCQMVLAAGAAILFRVNLPLSATVVWITNPITIPPVFYFAYLVGTWVLGKPPLPFEVDMSLEWFRESLDGIMGPLLLGSLICAVVSAFAGYVFTRLFWRWSVVKQWRERRANAGLRAASKIASIPSNEG